MTRSSALITGTASGIGAEVARRFAERGFHIIAVDRTPELAERTATDIGAAVTAVGCDLSDQQQTGVLCERIAGEWRDDLDVLVCNAGVVIPGDVADLSADDIDLHLDVLLRNPDAVDSCRAGCVPRPEPWSHHGHRLHGRNLPAASICSVLCGQGRFTGVSRCSQLRGFSHQRGDQRDLSHSGQHSDAATRGPLGRQRTQFSECRQDRR